MNIRVRAADIETDRQAIIDGIIKYLNPAADGARFDWLYKDNPFGAPRVWLAVEADDGGIVGALAAFPRQISLRNRQDTAWVLGDCWVKEQYRSLGPVLILQRACFSEIDSGAARFCYDFPSTAMMAVYKRLRIKPCFQMVRMAKPLRVDRKLEQFVSNAMIHRGLSIVGNRVLGFGAKKPKYTGNLTVSSLTGEFGAEFVELTANFRADFGVYLERSCEYLNWRYLKNPLARYEIWTATRGGTLEGYAVLLQEGDTGTLVDLFGKAEPAVLNALIDHCVALMSERGVQTLSAFVIETHPWRHLLESHGFKTREATPIVIYGSSNVHLLENKSWLVMSGDRDS